MWRTIDLVLRFIYVAAVPAMLPLVNGIMPIAGLLVGTGIATIVALIGHEVWRARVERIKYAGRVLGGFGRLGEFYARFPPKPLVYYIVYPVLLPVILFMRIPRTEFFLYRRVNAIAGIVIVGTGTWDYFEHWRPELTFAQFAGATLGVFILQLFVTFMFVMPIVTTLVELRQRRRIRLIWILSILMVASAAYGTFAVRHQRTMSIMTWMRLEERTKYARDALIECVKNREATTRECLLKDRELRAMAEALEAAADALDRAPNDADRALAVAREKLGAYYKPDEADAFRLMRDGDLYIVYARYARKPAIWVGEQKGKWIIHARDLPAALRKRLGV